MNSEPLVSIIVNCFNGARTLDRALQSICNQTYGNWEVIFWDNCSSDSSYAIAGKYGGKIRRIRAVRHTTLSEARGLALEYAIGDFIAFLDVDDIWYPEKLELQVKKIVKSNAVVCLGGVREVDEQGRTIRKLLPKYSDGDQFESHLRQFDVNMVTPLIRKSTLSRFGIKFDPEIIASEEYNLFIQLAAVGEFCSVQSVLGEWVINNSSLTNQSIHAWAADRRKTLEIVKAKFPKKVRAHGRAMRLAAARADYYEARYLISKNEWWNARRRLLRNVSVSVVYTCIFCCSMFPPVWRLFHNERIKRLVSVHILRASKAAIS